MSRLKNGLRCISVARLCLYKRRNKFEETCSPLLNYYFYNDQNPNYRHCFFGMPIDTVSNITHRFNYKKTSVASNFPAFVPLSTSVSIHNGGTKNDFLYPGDVTPKRKGITKNYSKKTQTVPPLQSSTPPPPPLSSSSSVPPFHTPPGLSQKQEEHIPPIIITESNENKKSKELQVVAKKDGQSTELSKPKKPLHKKIIDGVKHIYHGFRLLFIDIKVSSSLLFRVLRGHTLRRKEKLLVSKILFIDFTLFINLRRKKWVFDVSVGLWHRSS